MVLPLWQPQEHMVFLLCCQGHGALTRALTVPAQPPLALTHGSGPHFGPCPSVAIGSWSPALPQPCPPRPWALPSLTCMLTSWHGLSPFPSPRPCGCVWPWIPAPGLNLNPTHGGTSWPGLTPSPGRCLKAGAAPRLPLSLAGVVGQGAGSSLGSQPRGAPAAPGLCGALARVVSNLPNTTTVRPLSPFQLLRKINPQKS